MTNSTTIRVRHGLAHTVQGSGPTVVCVPGVGDLRSEYDALAPELVAAGFRVVVVDLPGHGDSPVPDSSPSRRQVGEALAALVAELGGEAHLIGCSLGASAAAVAAAIAPERVASVTLIGPFLRDHPPSLADRVQRAMLSLLLRRPWGPRAWTVYRASVFGAARPADLDEQHRRIRASLAEPGRMAVMREMALSSCHEVEAVLGSISASTMIVMGTADHDFPDPVAEARWAASATGGTVTLVDGAGHYPHLEAPEVATPAIRAFLRDITPVSG